MTRHASDHTIEVSVKVFGGLRDAFGQGEMQLRIPSDATLSALFEQLATSRPAETAKLVEGIDAGYLNVLVNGRNVHFLDGRDTRLSDHDSVAVLPPIGGG